MLSIQLLCDRNQLSGCRIVFAHKIKYGHSSTFFENRLNLLFGFCGCINDDHFLE